MTKLLSHLAEIDKLRFHPFPTRPIAMSKIVRAGPLLIGVGLKNGKLYATFPRDRQWTDDVFTALMRLGIASQSVADEHKAACIEHQRRYETRLEAAVCLKYGVPDLEKHGVKLTKTQLRILEKAAK